MESVAKKTARTSFWSAVERFANLGVNLVVQLILARILTPADFGVVAMLTVFIGISEAISECGFRNALIRKLDCSQDDYSTAFYVNFGVSVLLYLVLFFSAPFIADFYNMPLVCGLLRVYSLVFIFEALRIVQYAILCKRLEFKSIARISSSSVLLSGIIGVSMAYMGLGAWALVGQILSASVFYLFFITIKEKWIPKLVFKKQSFKYLWGFGSKMLLTGIISRVYSNIYGLIIGKYYNATTLGLFNNGQKYGQFFPTLIETIFVKNSLPILSGYQNNDERLKDLYRKFLCLVSFVTFPICIYFFILAKPFVVLLLTEKWLGAVPYFQIFTITAILIPANIINLNALQVKGRSDLTLKAEIIKKSVGFTVVFITVSFGAIYLAIGCSLMNLFSYYINVYYAKKILNLSVLDQLKDMAGALFASFVSALFVIPVLFLNLNAAALLVLSGLLYGITYFIVTRNFLRLDIYNQLLKVLVERKKAS